MPMKNEDRANAAKAGMASMDRVKRLMTGGRTEATQASEVGASQTTIDEKTGTEQKTVSGETAGMQNGTEKKTIAGQIARPMNNMINVGRKKGETK